MSSITNVLSMERAQSYYRSLDNKTVIYLDNAATSYPKPYKVIDEMIRCMFEYCANPGRAGHSMSVETGTKVMEVREKICDFFNVESPLQVCFTKNATEALNIGIKGVLEPGDHVITTSMEHNSVIRPLKTLERDIGIEITIIDGNNYGEIDPDQIEKTIKKNTKLVVITLSSNVNGVILPVKDIGKIVSKYEKIFMVDASQGAGSIILDMQDLHIDILAFPGHKGLLGPQGTGCLCVRKDIKLKSLIEGGTGSKSNDIFQPEMMPDTLESGTINVPGIVGLGYGLDFINSFGLDSLKLYKNFLLKKFMEGLMEINGISIHSKINDNSGIVALNINGLDSSETSYILNRDYKIATRGGLHCSPLAHRTLGTLKDGLVRFSVGCFNTLEEIEVAITAIKNIATGVNKSLLGIV